MKTPRTKQAMRKKLSTMEMKKTLSTMEMRERMRTRKLRRMARTMRGKMERKMKMIVSETESHVYIILTIQIMASRVPNHASQ